MDQEKMNPLVPEEFDQSPQDQSLEFQPKEDLDLDDLLGPDLMAILGYSSKAAQEIPAADSEELLPEHPTVPDSVPAVEQEEPILKREQDSWTPPVRRPRPQPSKTRKNTITFYTVYASLVIIVAAALLAVTIPLHNWLVRYEASQPEQQRDAVFSQIFADPDWAVIYDLAEVRDTTFEGKDDYVRYMQEKVAAAKNPQLTCTETSAGLSGDRKYIIKLDDKKIATFTLESSPGEEGMTNWKLGVVEVFFQREQSVSIEKLPEYTVFVNGVALDASYTVRTVATKAEDYLSGGIHGYRMEVQHVDGLLVHPDSVYVVNSKGEDVPTVYDAATNTYKIPLPSAAEITGEEREIALNAAEANALYAIGAIGAGTLRKYFDPNSQVYNDIIETPMFSQSYASYAFDKTVTGVHDFRRYSDHLFSARVTLKLDVTRKNGTVKTLEMDTTYFFTKNASGVYLANQMTNVPVQELVEQVRLTFVSGEQKLASSFVTVGTDTVTLPSVETPEGFVFRGWAQQTTDEAGNITQTILFIPNEAGEAAVPEDLVLEPMTLYAVFEAEGATAQ